MATPPDSDPGAQQLQRVLDAVALELALRFGCDAVALLALQNTSAVGATKMSPAMIERHGGADKASAVLAREVEAMARQLIAEPVSPKVHVVMRPRRR